MKNRSEAFGRLLKAGIGSIASCEGRTAAVVEEELGAAIGVSGDTIQRYKSGFLPPETRTVQLLAEAAVRRGFLGREWLERFLHAARYPAPERLLDELCPAPQRRPQAERVYENLPAPTYSQFVMRQQAFAEVLDGLRQRSAAVLIVGLGGNGKTSLAREIAAHCLRTSDLVLRFDAAVWVSDKDFPGTTNLSTVLNGIARTLDYPGFTQFEHEEKRYEVEQLLRRQRVLLLLDNFETVTDSALVTWLLRLPEPSKVIITTREYRREFRRGGWPVDLRGMSESEAWQLISERARTLKVEHLLSERRELDPLLMVTGGNPKALAMAMGLLKYEHRPLTHIVEDLYAARGELFEDLFTRTWALLDEAARRVLLISTFFSTSAASEALSAAADVMGFAFDRAMERLVDLALLDVQQPDANNLPRYMAHPLVRAFATTRLAEQPAFEAGARERWLAWCVGLARQVGTCWNDLSRLDLLDPEHQILYDAIQWAWHQHRARDTVSLIDGIRFYCNVRGHWDMRITVTRLRVEATREDPEQPEEVLRSLAYYIEALCKQGTLDEAEHHIAELHTIAQTVSLRPINRFRYHHTLAIHAAAHHDYDAAEQHLQTIEAVASELGGQPFVVNLRWLGLCAYFRGDREKAQRLLHHSLQEARRVHDDRSAIGNTIQLAAIDIDREDFAAAAQKLEAAYAQIQVYRDRRRMSELLPLYARFHSLRGDLPAARASLLEAVDLFERLGMRRQLGEARAALTRLAASNV